MNELVKYLLENLMIDFQGDLDLEQVKGFLQGDDSRLARALLGKLVSDGGVEEMMVTLADCLREYISEGINEEVIQDQVQIYAES